MSGKAELVRFTRKRAPHDPEDTNSMSYGELKKEINDIINTASKAMAKITIITLVEVSDTDKKK